MIVEDKEMQKNEDIVCQNTMYYIVSIGNPQYDVHNKQAKFKS